MGPEVFFLKTNINWECLVLTKLEFASFDPVVAKKIAKTKSWVSQPYTCMTAGASERLGVNCLVYISFSSWAPGTKDRVQSCMAQPPKKCPAGRKNGSLEGFEDCSCVFSRVFGRMFQGLLGGSLCRVSGIGSGLTHSLSGKV